MQDKLFSYLTINELKNTAGASLEKKEKKKQENTIEKTKSLIPINTSRLTASLLFSTPQQEAQKEVYATKTSILAKK